MKTSSLFLVLAAAAVVALLWLVRPPLIAPVRPKIPQPVPEAEKTPPPKSKRVKHKARSAVAEQPKAADAADPVTGQANQIAQKVAPPAPAPRPFPDVAQIPVGSDAEALARFREPSFRTISAEHGGVLKETYVYCPGGTADTWVRLNNGKIVAKYEAAHPPNGYNR